MDPILRYNASKSTAQIMTTKEWMITLLLSAIPVVNLILMLIWAFGGNANPNKRTYARASLIWAAIVIVVYVVFIAAVFVGAANA